GRAGRRRQRRTPGGGPPFSLHPPAAPRGGWPDRLHRRAAVLQPESDVPPRGNRRLGAVPGRRAPGPLLRPDRRSHGAVRIRAGRPVLGDHVGTSPVLLEEVALLGLLEGADGP